MTNVTHRRSILVIEDVAPVRELLCTVLTDCGFDVTGCPDGLSALDDAAKRGYDCVITDYRMPRMNGVERNGDIAGRSIPYTSVSI